MTAANMPRRRPAPLTQGVVWIHASQRALRTHLEWALGTAIGDAVRCIWQPQPHAPGFERTELHWNGPAGTGAAIASALAGWRDVRFEVTEQPTATTDGTRWMHTPTLGIGHAQIGPTGDIVIAEDRMRAAIDFAGRDQSALLAELDSALCGPWDRELERFRHASDDSPVIWLSRVS